MPLLRVKKQVFHWLNEGKKTIDIRKGFPKCGDTATFLCGPFILKFKITKKESGRLVELVRSDNFRSVIPCAQTLDEAINYLRSLFADYDGVFTAYHVSR